jgi:cytochrome c
MKDMRGEERIDAKDPDGKLFVREIIEVATEKGSGWVEYRWYDPKVKETLLKAVYFEKVDDVINGCGVYKQ